MHLIAAIDFANILGYAIIIIKVAVALGLVIFVHELGHFLAAKACGVKCEKFYIGFDVPIKIGPFALPRTLGKVQWGETEYGIGILPLGGYVKMLGQDDDPRNAAAEAERIKVRKEEENAENSGTDDDSQSQLSAGEKDRASDEKDQDANEKVAAGEPFELDPRSYPAKSVPQRMVIISAGVIMNLITAVIFATFAYGFGVIYTPCEIAGVAPGDPAWVYGLAPGDRILQIGRDGEPDPHLRFDFDLRQQVGESGIRSDGKGLELLIQHGDEKPQWVNIKPAARNEDKPRRVALGVVPPSSTKLDSKMPFWEYRAAGQAKPAFQGGDRIIAVNGERLPRDAETGEILGYHLEKLLADQIGETLTIQVERQAEGSSASQSTLDITLPPQPMKELGLAMKIGPILAVRNNSPAAAAGFKPDDIIKTVQGQKIEDPFTLPQQIDALAGLEVVIEVERGAGDKRETVKLVLIPEQRDHYVPNYGRISIESIGVAYDVSATLASVEQNGPAAKAGLQVEDEIVSVHFEAVGADKKELAGKLFSTRAKKYDDLLDLKDNAVNWMDIHSLLQNYFPGILLHVHFLRDGKEEQATITPVMSHDRFNVDRGLRLTSFRRVHTAQSWNDAFSLGLRETKESLQQVFRVLSYLGSGKITPKDLGSPIMIAAVAGSEASVSIQRLLLFLTLISANLAILNFLPIPALDGGHMVFLSIEAVIGRPVDERLQGTLTLIGVGCLLCLMLFVFINDIGRFTGWGG